MWLVATVSTARIQRNKHGTHLRRLQGYRIKEKSQVHRQTLREHPALRVGRKKRTGQRGVQDMGKEKGRQMRTTMYHGEERLSGRRHLQFSVLLKSWRMKTENRLFIVLAFKRYIFKGMVSIEIRLLMSRSAWVNFTLQKFVDRE